MSVDEKIDKKQRFMGTIIQSIKAQLTILIL
jgi:hypothetical protein